MTYYDIVPESVVLQQPKATAISVNICADNLTTSAQFQVGFYYKQDEQYTLFFTAYVDCTGSDYAGWDGNNQFPVTFSADQLGLTLK